MSVQQIRPVSYPAAPTLEPIDGTLLSIVTPTRPGEGQTWLAGEAMYPSYGCISSGVVLAETCGPVSEDKFTDVESPGWVDGFKFAAYGAAVCKLIDPAELEAGTERAYTAAESRVIEQGLMAVAFSESDGSDPNAPGAWDAATDLTPAAFATTGIDPVVGLGILEAHMSRFYAGKGIIHMTRGTATVLDQSGALDWEGAKLVTTLKTPVAAGSGYDYPNLGPDGTEAPEGTKWIYATGQVSVIQQRLKTISTFNIYGDPGDDTPGVQPNDFLAMSEGVYLATVDCYKAAVLVKLYEEA